MLVLERVGQQRWCSRQMKSLINDFFPLQCKVQKISKTIMNIINRNSINAKMLKFKISQIVLTSWCLGCAHCIHADTKISPCAALIQKKCIQILLLYISTMSKQTSSKQTGSGKDFLEAKSKTFNITFWCAGRSLFIVPLNGSGVNRL